MKIYAPILLFIISMFLSLLIVKEYFYDMPQCATSTDCKSCARRGGCAWCLNKSRCVPTDRMGYPLYRDCLDKDIVTFENNCDRVSSSDRRTTTISTDDTGSTGNGNDNWFGRTFNYGNSSDTYGRGILDDISLNLGLKSWMENNTSWRNSLTNNGDSWNKYANNNSWNYNVNNWYQDGSGNWTQDGSGNWNDYGPGYDPYESSDASGNKPACGSRKTCRSCAALNDCAWCKDTNTCVETDRGKSVGNKCADMSLLAFVESCSDSGPTFTGNNSGNRWGDYIPDNELYDENGHDLSCLNNQNGISKITGRRCSDLDPYYQSRINAYGIADLDPSGNPWSSNNVPGNRYLRNADGKDVTCINNRYGHSKISGLPCRYLDPVSNNYVERFGMEKFSNYNPLNFMQQLISEQLKRNGLPSKETFTGSIIQTIRNAIRSK